jgi:ADP-ribosylglycohydrolase/O-acetyl-ADP-ribose deacetylase (regulator of RNase III)
MSTVKNRIQMKNDETKKMKPKFTLTKGDITAIQVDAIVNAANTSLLGGGGVDGAIHKAGGSQILEECIAIRNNQGGCNVGEAVITTAGNLPSKFVIHTVGPVWNGDKEEKKILLANCYKNSVQLAEVNSIKTIAFPNISTGIYRFPKADAAALAFEVLSTYDYTCIEEIIFVCFDEENYELYKNFITPKNIVADSLFGLASGDALGVPVEFKSRDFLKLNPVEGMQEFGTYNQPKGTWSDDSSLSFCLADSLCTGYNLNDIALKFTQWKNAEIWTPHGIVFDIGDTTARAIDRIIEGIEPEFCGGAKEEDNGNGSLMRILPLAFYLKNEDDINVIYKSVSEVSSITHAHFRSIFAGFIYVIFAKQLINGTNKFEAYTKMKLIVTDFISCNNFNENEMSLFDRILKQDIASYGQDEIYSSGYVLHSIEASLWCVLKYNTYADTVLSAVNLGSDTDTTAAIAGGVAGIIYGLDAMPLDWRKSLIKYQEIENLANNLNNKIS